SARACAATVAYYYSVEGRDYSGQYCREFGGEEEALEFVRELQGISVMVSYDPRNATKSMLTEDAVTALLSMRSPVSEESKLQSPVSNVSGWVKPLLWPFITLSAVGLFVSLWIHLG